ncbi:MAG: glycerol kinase GlpK [Corynebacterium sp.]|nr:glycerol kinase GlpK [Corynebacterium sp.]
MVPPSSNKYVASIDQGTTSTRCILFDANGEIAGSGQFEHEQIFPQKGWVEHDPIEIWDNTRRAVAAAIADADAFPSQVVALGITNQRETTVVWDKNTGEPVYNAIVWQDTRTSALCEQIAGPEGVDRWRHKTGMTLTSYPSGPKVRWILDNVPGAREKAEAGDLLFGTIDTWLIWNLTGGAEGDKGLPALHVTDVTNASRTCLMNLETLEWDDELIDAMSIPRSMLPEIRPSVANYRTVRERGTLAGVPICGVLGDQHAAMFGQACFRDGDAKNTYGTGLFMLLNTGTKPRFSDNGLITTVCYQIEGQKPVYALEGSVAVGGSLVQWLRDNLQIIPDAPTVETYAKEVPDNGGVYVVPAFSGLFAPRWRSDARGVIVGLTRFANRNHIARAVIEATAYQTREVLDAMVADSGVPLNELKVDGGMVKNELLMQFQSDIIDTNVVRPKIIETTALGAAYAAGLYTGFWDSLDVLKEKNSVDKVWNPQMPAVERDHLYSEWNRAVERTFNWEQ